MAKLNVRVEDHYFTSIQDTELMDYVMGFLQYACDTNVVEVNGRQNLQKVFNGTLLMAVIQDLRRKMQQHMKDIDSTFGTIIKAEPAIGSCVKMSLTSTVLRAALTALENDTNLYVEFEA